MQEVRVGSLEHVRVDRADRLEDARGRVLGSATHVRHEVIAPEWGDLLLPEAELRDPPGSGGQTVLARRRDLHERARFGCEQVGLRRLPRGHDVLEERGRLRVGVTRAAQLIDEDDEERVMKPPDPVLDGLDARRTDGRVDVPVRDSVDEPPGFEVGNVLRIRDGRERTDEHRDGDAQNHS